MILKLYIAVLLTTAIDEQWNINNPRPNPNKTYNRLQWEKADFFTYKINNQWVLRPYRKTDSKLKEKVRKKYWKKRGKLKK
jgi:hypothetical protein